MAQLYGVTPGEAYRWRELLIESASMFRFYEAQHKAKVPALQKKADILEDIGSAASIGEAVKIRAQIADTIEKARVNAEIAERIEAAIG